MAGDLCIGGVFFEGLEVKLAGAHGLVRMGLRIMGRLCWMNMVIAPT